MGQPEGGGEADGAPALCVRKSCKSCSLRCWGVGSRWFSARSASRPTRCGLQESWKQLETTVKMRPKCNACLALGTIASPRTAAKTAAHDWLGDCVQELEEKVELAEARRATVVLCQP